MRPDAVLAMADSSVARPGVVTFSSSVTQAGGDKSGMRVTSGLGEIRRMRRHGRVAEARDVDPEIVQEPVDFDDERPVEDDGTEARSGRLQKARDRQNGDGTESGHISTSHWFRSSMMVPGLRMRPMVPAATLTASAPAPVVVAGTCAKAVFGLMT